MARIKLPLPDTFRFSTEIPVRITDINYGGHLGNDAMLGILQEARVRFLGSLGFSETDVGGAGIIMVDAALVYRSEAFHGDVLRVDVDCVDMQVAGCDVVYRVVNAATGREVARAKTAIAFFDYGVRRVVAMPGPFRVRMAELR